MKKQHFNAQIAIGDEGYLKVSLDIVFFAEGKYIVAYCPALDLSVAGKDEKEAKREFAQMFVEYATDCIERKTLKDDLRAHGWKISESKYEAPTITQMLVGNEILRNIFDTKNYKKEVVSIPQISISPMAFA